MLIYFLFAQAESLKVLLFIPSDAKEFGMPHLILLGIYGLAYCYIASAPILIFHAGRGLLFERGSINIGNSNKLRERVLPFINKYRLLLYVPVIVIPLAYYISVSKNISDLSAVVIFVGVLSLEVQLLILIFTSSWKITVEYSEKIAKKRKANQDTGYVESYKHLREHGNSFLIVFFEFALAIPIYTFVSQPFINKEDAVRHLCLIVFVWIMPAACIWFFGNKLENNLKNMP